MTDLLALGFSEVNSGVENRAIMEAALLRGGDVRLDAPGVYPLADTVYVGSDTTLSFGAGVYIRREHDGTTHGSLFVNRGALSSEWNKNISILGLKVINDGVFSDPYSPKVVAGLRAIVAFSYVRDVVIRDFLTEDLPKESYAIQVCSFDGLLIENVRVEGKKDGIHLGRGKNFAIRHGVFRTYDDPIALNGHDYSSANPQLGWIENGVIEDCHDLADEDSVGYFCRILGGSWLDWERGMRVQQSDTVASCGRLYRVVMPPDGREYVSLTRPTHERGTAELDGIKWALVQSDAVYSAGCRNISFRNIFLNKKRAVAFSIHFDKDRYSRSVYPHSTAPVQENLVFENVFCNNEVAALIESRTPVVGVKIVNCFLNETKIRLGDIETEGVSYPPADVIVAGCTVRGDFTVECSPSRRAVLRLAGNDIQGSLTVSGNVTVMEG